MNDYIFDFVYEIAMDDATKRMAYGESKEELLLEMEKVRLIGRM